MTVEAIESTAIEVREPSTTLALVPDVQASDLVARLDVIKEAMRDAMIEDTDYGRIPGTDKPALLKPGAEKLGVLFQLDVQLSNEKAWGPGDHLTVESKATVYHSPSGSRLGFGEGLCSTREKKYAYRNSERLCPVCNAAAVIKGKAEYGGGWLCWARRGGCGAKFNDGEPLIEDQKTGQVDNPDLPDLWNTVMKMAEKRARVDAVLAVTGASALFTQDVEITPAADAQAPEFGSRAEAAAVPPRRPALLTASQRDRVLAAIDEAKQPLELVLAYCGVESVDRLTTDHAVKIRSFLDELLNAPSDIPNGLEAT